MQANDQPRRYADYVDGEVPPAPDGRATIRISVSVDIWSWAEANGVTAEEAEQVMSGRAQAGSKAVMAVFVRTLGDLQPLSMQVETT